MENVNALFHKGFPIPEFLKPLGLSFFILSSVSYLADVYHQKVTADRNLGRLTLFLGFFPQIVEGPICPLQRHGPEQLWNVGAHHLCRTVTRRHPAHPATA